MTTLGAQFRSRAQTPDPTMQHLNPGMGTSACSGCASLNSKLTRARAELLEMKRRLKEHGAAAEASLGRVHELEVELERERRARKEERERLASVEDRVRVLQRQVDGGGSPQTVLPPLLPPLSASDSPRADGGAAAAEAARLRMLLAAVEQQRADANTARIAEVRGALQQSQVLREGGAQPHEERCRFLRNRAVHQRRSLVAHRDRNARTPHRACNSRAPRAARRVAPAHELAAAAHRRRSPGALANNDAGQYRGVPRQRG